MVSRSMMKEWSSGGSNDNMNQANIIKCSTNIPFPTSFFTYPEIFIMGRLRLGKEKSSDWFFVCP